MSQIKTRIQKGKELEKYVLSLAENIFSDAKRQPGSGSGLRKGDVVFGNFIVECKNSKRFDWKQASEQIKREAMGYQIELIIWHPPNKSMDNSVVIINILDFFELLKKIENSKSIDEILDKYQIKNNLEKAIYFLKKVVKNI